jgi:hypothetical protein
MSHVNLKELTFQGNNNVSGMDFWEWGPSPPLKSEEESKEGRIKGPELTWALHSDNIPGRREDGTHLTEPEKPRPFFSQSQSPKELDMVSSQGIESTIQFTYYVHPTIHSYY